MTQDAVTNSTCIIALQRIGQLGLLLRVFGKVFVPPVVQAELGTPIDFLYVRARDNPAVADALKTQLDDGEAQAIALAMELGDVFIILDDKKARRVGRQIGLKVMGTLGILLRAKRLGVLTNIQPVLADLRNTRFHMTPALYKETLRLAGEEESE